MPMDEGTLEDNNNKIIEVAVIALNEIADFMPRTRSMVLNDSDGYTASFSQVVNMIRIANEALTKIYGMMPESSEDLSSNPGANTDSALSSG